MDKYDKEYIKKRQQMFKDSIIQKIDDYLMDEPDEDEADCELYFRKGEEEQRKSISYIKPGLNPSKNRIDSIALCDVDCFCPNCNEYIVLLDEMTLDKADIKWCPFCGSKLPKRDGVH